MEEIVKRKLLTGTGIVGVSLLLAASPALAEEATDPSVYLQAVMDNLWVFIAGILVFFMQAGFALVEAGLTRSKNVANIMAKNIADMCIGVLAFYAVGYAFAYGDGGGWFIGGNSYFLSGSSLFEITDGLSGATDFFFQVVFAATAVTIASGAMAGRTKFSAYLLFSALMTAFIYPIVVHWTWGGGLIAKYINWGDAISYSDFAGSGIVHLTGGVAALMGAIALGPRIGKYGPDGKPRAIPGHNIVFTVIGVFILWLGWFGFNPGSELAADGYVMSVAVNTLIAAAAGGAVSAIVVVMKTGKPDVGMVGNGVLGGLVGITAGCGAFNTFGSLITGAVAGALVVYSVLFIEKKGIDDPVGAVSVHGTCGIWGVLAIGLFSRYDDAFLGRDDAGLFYGGGFDQLSVQAVMVVIIIAWTAITAGIAFQIIKKTTGLRVSPEEEAAGLDISEHGAAGYHLEITSN
ncbi:MAG: ammonium transporter [Acidimicrobiaceae bacterium]|nr:ammonium transporter [Acidimicrobiaceae bacterium]